MNRTIDLSGLSWLKAGVMCLVNWLKTSLKWLNPFLSHKTVSFSKTRTEHCT